MSPVLLFVRLSGSPVEGLDLEILARAFDAAESSSIAARMVDVDQIQSLLSTRRGEDVLYVCSPFKGPVFEQLEKNGCRVIGPQCVLSCIMLTMPVPHKTHPVCNIAMQDVVVCCSSMRRQDREVLHRLVLFMGGQVSGDFTSIVTHLVADEVGSKKYQVACSLNKPVLLPTWVHYCWEQSQYKHIVAADYSITRLYSTPLFKGCTVCVTGMTAEERKRVKDIVINCGGQYSGELSMKTCTHLLAKFPHGDKYMFAKEWKIHCVHPRWLEDCLSAGHWLDEASYQLDASSQILPACALMQRTHVDSTCQNSFFDSDVSLSTRSKVDQVALKSAESFRQPQLNSKSINEHVLLSSSGKVTVNTSNIESLLIETFVIPTEDLSYLDGCKIFMCGISGAAFDLCRRIINTGGGIRLNSLNFSATHILVGDQLSSEVKTFIESEDRLPHIVSPIWLLESCMQGKCLDEKKYSVVVAAVDERGPGITAVTSVKSVATGYRVGVMTVEEEERGVIDADIFAQYLPDNESTRLSHIGLDVSRLQRKSLVKEERCKESYAENHQGVEMDLKPDVTQNGFTTSTHMVLAGLTFACKRLDSVEIRSVEEVVNQYGGLLTGDIVGCDFILVPLTYDVEIEIDRREVTLVWLEQSVFNEALADVDAWLIYRPVFIPRSCAILKNCVVTISQYSGLEKEHLSHFVELLGGVAQDFFVRKASAGHLANTHLLLKDAQGQKYGAALKWNVPCVTKDWLFDCALQRRKLPEASFAVPFLSEQPAPTKKRLSTTNGALAAGLRINSDLDRADRNMSLDHFEKNVVVMRNIVVDSHSNQVQVPVKSMETNKVCASFEKIDLKSRGIDARHVSAPYAVASSYQNIVEKENFLSETSPGNVKPVFELGKPRYSFDFEDALDMMASPAAPSRDSRRSSRLSRRSRASLPFELQFEAALRNAMTNIPDDMKIEQDDDQDKESSLHVSEAGEKSSKTDVLMGVVLAVSKRLSPRQAELHNLASSMGADCRFMYDDTCTHFVHQGKSSDVLKDVCDAKRGGANLVSPYWLEACLKYGCRVDESSFPPTFNPRMSLEVTSTRGLSSATSNNDEDAPKCRQSLEDEPGVPVASLHRELLQQNSSCTVQDASVGHSLEKLECQRKMEKIMEATKSSRNQRKSRRQASASAFNAKVEESGSSSAKKLRARSSPQQKSSNDSSSRNSDASSGRLGHCEAAESPKRPCLMPAVAADHITEPSQGDVITYDDPAGRHERERILAQLKAASPSQKLEPFVFPEPAFVEDHPGVLPKPGCAAVSCVNNGSTARVDVDGDVGKASVTSLHENVSGCQTNLAKQGREVTSGIASEGYRFLFSGLTPQEKIEYSAVIERLGGIVLDAQYFTLQCTHVIAGAPSRNEKFLASIAAGKWLLHKSFLEASREAGHFVLEESHEWGSDNATSNPHAAAARRWRMELREVRATVPTAGAFSNWNVLLCVDKSRQPGLKRLLEAGDAKVLAVRPPFANAASATHAFIADASRAEEFGVDLVELHASGIWILRPDYIAEYLLVFPTPHAFKYILPEIRALTSESEKVSTPSKRKAIQEAHVHQSKRTRN